MGFNNTAFLTGPEVPAKSDEPKYLALVLHGVGADGNNMMPVAQYFSEFIPEAHFICPNGIESYDMAPFGYQWFSLKDRSKDFQYNELVKARNKMIPYIDKQLERMNLTYNELILISFSQGTMLSMHIAPRLNSPIRAVAGFSGAMCCGDALAREVKSKPPFFLVHGEEDEVVLPENLYTAARTLTGAGFKVETLMLDDLGHSIDERGMHFMQKHLKSIL
jgi:phospholipase/carboxylesterase